MLYDSEDKCTDFFCLCTTYCILVLPETVKKFLMLYVKKITIGLIL